MALVLLLSSVHMHILRSTMHSTCSVRYKRARTVALGTKELVDFMTRMHGWSVGKGGVLGYGQNLQSPDPHTQTKFSNPIQTSNQRTSHSSSAAEYRSSCNILVVFGFSSIKSVSARLAQSVERETLSYHVLTDTIVSNLKVVGSTPTSGFLFAVLLSVVVLEGRNWWCNSEGLF
jgi:hypothetical protein